MVRLNIGSRAQVMHGTAKQTAGGLTKKQLKYNKHGKIVSRKASNAAKKSKNLIKAGYITRKGQFGAVKNGGASKRDRNTNNNNNNADKRGRFNTSTANASNREGPNANINASANANANTNINANAAKRKQKINIDKANILYFYKKVIKIINNKYGNDYLRNELNILASLLNKLNNLTDFFNMTKKQFILLYYNPNNPPNDLTIYQNFTKRVSVLYDILQQQKDKYLGSTVDDKHRMMSAIFKKLKINFTTKLFRDNFINFIKDYSIADLPLLTLDDFLNIKGNNFTIIQIKLIIKNINLYVDNYYQKIIQRLRNL